MHLTHPIIPVIIEHDKIFYVQVLKPNIFKCEKKHSGISRDKTVADKLMYIPNDDKTK